MRHELDHLRNQLSKTIKLQATPFTQGDGRARRAKCHFNTLEFINTYLPHYMPGGCYNAFHREMNAIFHEILLQESYRALGKEVKGVKRAVAAPRSNGKTTLLKAFVLQALVYGHKSFIVLISDTFDQAAELLAAVKVELEENPRLEMDFPFATGKGGPWSSGQIQSRNGVKIKAFGSGKRIRGATYGVRRPDLVILDDLENDEEVRSPINRENLFDWLFKSVLPLGPPDHSHALLVLGTLLHYDSVLARLLKHPSFQGRKFKALLQFPRFMNLWEEMERLFWAQGEEEARTYYLLNREQMDEGAKVLWPQVQGLYSLMLKRCENRASFNSEYQNEPLEENERIFRHLTFYEELPRIEAYFGAIDPSMGKRGRHNDPMAIVILGRSPEGICFVVEALIAHLGPQDAILKVVELQEYYRCFKWAVEEVQFQEFFKQQLIKESLARGVPLPAEGVRPHSDKKLRISSLQPHVHNGVIRFRPDQVQLLEQLEFFPKADHDDGPDALHMAFQIAQQAAAAQILSRGLGGGSSSGGMSQTYWGF